MSSKSGMETVTRRAFTKAKHRGSDFGLASARGAREMVEAFFEELVEEVRAGGVVRVQGFGIFRMKRYGERKLPGNRTAAPSSVLKFSASKRLRGVR